VTEYRRLEPPIVHETLANNQLREAQRQAVSRTESVITWSAAAIMNGLLAVASAIERASSPPSTHTSDGSSTNVEGGDQRDEH
jgi:hypothetical protein